MSMFCDGFAKQIEVAGREVTKLVSENLFSDIYHVYYTTTDIKKQ